MIWVFIQFLVLTKLFNVLCELGPVSPNVGFDSVTLFLANLALFKQLIQVFFQLILKVVYLSHFSLHRNEIIFLFFKLFLAIFFDFLTRLRVEQKLISRNFVLFNLFSQLLFCKIELLNVFLPSGDLLVKLAQIAG